MRVSSDATNSLSCAVEVKSRVQLAARAHFSQPTQPLFKFCFCSKEDTAQIPTAKPGRPSLASKFFFFLSATQGHPYIRRRMKTGFASILDYRIEAIHHSAGGHCKFLTSGATIHSTHQPDGGDPEPREPAEPAGPAKPLFA